MTTASSPPGWIVERRRRDLLYVRQDLLDALRGAGLGSADDWRNLLARAPGGTGRGATARLELLGGPRVVVKKMRRGGLAARLWRDRFAGTRRLLANLTVAEEAKRRGIATPSPVALCLRADGLGLYQAWLMIEEIAQARDLLSVFKEGAPPPGVLEAAMGLVRRMHDAGLHHRDLNLGNLLVREDPPGTREAFVIDLDRAVLRPGPLDDGDRLRALLRLERSYVKHVGAPGPLGDDAHSVWLALYTGDDADLAGRLEAARRAPRGK